MSDEPRTEERPILLVLAGNSYQFETERPRLEHAYPKHRLRYIRVASDIRGAHGRLRGGTTDFVTVGTPNDRRDLREIRDLLNHAGITTPSEDPHAGKQPTRGAS